MPISLIKIISKVIHIGRKPMFYFVLLKGIMAAKKKGGVVKVAMVCSVCKATNYFTDINKATTPKLAQSKYCKHCKKHTEHTSKEKLK